MPSRRSEPSTAATIQRRGAALVRIGAEGQPERQVVRFYPESPFFRSSLALAAASRSRSASRSAAAASALASTLSSSAETSRSFAAVSAFAFLRRLTAARSAAPWAGSSPR